MLQVILPLPDPSNIVDMGTRTLHASWAKQNLSLCPTEYLLKLTTRSSPLPDYSLAPP